MTVPRQRRAHRAAAAVTALLGLASLPAAAQQATDGGQTLQQTVVDGFRSAKFGMSEDDVRQAIMIDFHVDADTVKHLVDPVGRTTALEVIVPDVLPNGGKAIVDYLFGYRSHALISAAVTWSGKIDPTVTDRVLSDNGTTLQNYFRTAGYKADTIRMNVLVPALGYVLFEGRDVEGHMTQLVYGGDLKESQPQHLELRPTSLALRYIADPVNPDVFRIAPGQF
jgi:hypothetical protein